MILHFVLRKRSDNPQCAPRLCLEAHPRHSFLHRGWIIPLHSSSLLVSRTSVFVFFQNARKTEGIGGKLKPLAVRNQSEKNQQTFLVFQQSTKTLVGTGTNWISFALGQRNSLFCVMGIKEPLFMWVMKFQCRRVLARLLFPVFFPASRLFSTREKFRRWRVGNGGRRSNVAKVSAGNGGICETQK